MCGHPTANPDHAKLSAVHRQRREDRVLPRLPALHLLLNEAPLVMERRRRTRRGTDVRQQASAEDVIGYLRLHAITLTYDPAAGTPARGYR